MRANTYITAMVSLVALFLAGCAKITTPTGGPKDSTPPRVLKVEPADGTVRFDEKQIRIWFDEFVTVNNPNENVLISPPLTKNPD